MLIKFCGAEESECMDPLRASFSAECFPSKNQLKVTRETAGGAGRGRQDYNKLKCDFYQNCEEFISKT